MVSVVSEVSDPPTIIRHPLARALRTIVKIKNRRALNDKSKITDFTDHTDREPPLPFGSKARYGCAMNLINSNGSFRMGSRGRGSCPTPKSQPTCNFLEG
jgi:hypothetical protein